MFKDNLFNKIEKKTNVKKETILSLAEKLKNNNMKDEKTIREVINDLCKITGKEITKEKEDKIDVLPMLITIKTNQKNFSFAFRSLVAHELLHAYECFKRKANRVNFRPDNGSWQLAASKGIAVDAR